MLEAVISELEELRRRQIALERVAFRLATLPFTYPLWENRHDRKRQQEAHTQTP